MEFVKKAVVSFSFLRYSCIVISFSLLRYLCRLEEHLDSAPLANTSASVNGEVFARGN